MEESCVVVAVVQGRRCVAVELSEVFGIGWGFVLDKGGVAATHYWTVAVKCGWPECCL